MNVVPNFNFKTKNISEELIEYFREVGVSLEYKLNAFPGFESGIFNVEKKVILILNDEPFYESSKIKEIPDVMSFLKDLEESREWQSSQKAEGYCSEMQNKLLSQCKQEFENEMIPDFHPLVNTIFNLLDDSQKQEVVKEYLKII